MIYHFKSLVLVRKGRAFYATLYQEVFFGNPGGGGSLTVYNATASEYSLVYVMDEICPTEVEGCF